MIKCKGRGFGHCGRGATNIAAGSDGTAGIMRSTLVGLMAIFVPISIVQALVLVDFTGGRGLMWGRRRIGPNGPSWSGSG